MNHELAKELKDTGLTFEYPETRENTYSYLDSSGNPCSAMGKDAAYVPTLSELISACGVGLMEIQRSGLGSSHWYAEGALDGWEKEGEGSTPEEAVARLWLALHKK